MIFSVSGGSVVRAALGLEEDSESSNFSVPESTFSTPVSIANFSSTYTENFNSLPSTGTDLNISNLPGGWTYLKSDSSTTFSVDDGSTVSSNIYSYGTTGETDRALGVLDDSVMTGTVGVSFTNDTGRQIKAFTLSYTGEQWRRGAGTGDKLTFEYCVGCGNFGSGSWTAVSSLDFAAPFTNTNSSQINKARDGNNNTNKTAKSGTLTVAVNDGQTIRFRWSGANIDGADDGLSVDDFSLRAVPTVPETSITANPTAISSSTSASFSFSSDDAAATFECSLDGASYAACTSPRSFTGLTNGSHTFNVRSTSATGTDSTPGSFTWTVDNVSPTTAFTSAPSGTRASTSESISFTATDATSGVASSQCSLNNATFTSCSSPVSLTGLAQGAQSFRVRSTDNAGNVSTIQTASWTVDTVAPAISTFTPLANGPATGARDISFNVTDAGTVSSVAVETSISSPSVSEGGQEAPTVYTTSFTSAPCALTNAPNSTYKCTIPGAPAGSSVSYRVIAQDAAGNSRSVPSSGSFTYLVTNSEGSTPLPPGTYDNLSLDSTVTIAGDVTINGALSLSGAVEAGDSLVTFGCSATASGTGFIVGSVNKEFCGASSFTYPIGVNEPGVNFNGEVDGEQGATLPVYAPATITVLSVTGPSSVTIDAFVGQLTGVAPTHFTGIYWSTRETGDLTADLRFGWDVSSEVGSSGLYTPIRRSSTTEVVPGTVNTLGRFVDFPAISVFDGSGSPLVDGPSGITVPYYWTAALIGTSAGRNELSGKVTSAEGLPLRGVSVTLIGGDLSEPMTVRTNQFGVYNFNGLEAGATYVVNVNSGRFTFSNNSRIVYLADNLTSENFVADRR